MAKPNKGLGRGLEALLGSNPKEQNDEALKELVHSVSGGISTVS